MTEAMTTKPDLDAIERKYPADHAMRILVAEIRRLQQILNEVRTNGEEIRNSSGKMKDWAIAPEVYDMVCEESEP